VRFSVRFDACLRRGQRERVAITPWIAVHLRS
jgi:hypothetical protein